MSSATLAPAAQRTDTSGQELDSRCVATRAGRQGRSLLVEVQMSQPPRKALGNTDGDMPAL